MLPPIISTTPNSPTVWAKPRTAGGEVTGPGQGQGDAEEGVQGRGAQGGGRFQGPLADGLEGILQGLHHEGQGVENRRHHQAGEGEGQQAQAQGLGELADRPVGPQATSR
jgi:hypothetical protein